MVDLFGLGTGGYSVKSTLKNNLSPFYPCLDLRIDSVQPHDYPLPVGADASVTFKLRGAKSRVIRRVLTLDF